MAFETIAEGAFLNAKGKRVGVYISSKNGMQYGDSVRNLEFTKEDGVVITTEGLPMIDKVHNTRIVLRLFFENKLDLLWLIGRYLKDDDNTIAVAVSIDEIGYHSVGFLDMEGVEYREGVSNTYILELAFGDFNPLKRVKAPNVKFISSKKVFNYIGFETLHPKLRGGLELPYYPELFIERRVVGDNASMYDVLEAFAEAMCGSVRQNVQAVEVINPKDFISSTWLGIIAVGEWLAGVTHATSRGYKTFRYELKGQGSTDTLFDVSYISGGHLLNNVKKLRGERSDDVLEYNVGTPVYNDRTIHGTYPSIISPKPDGGIITRSKSDEKWKPSFILIQGDDIAQISSAGKVGGNVTNQLQFFTEVMTPDRSELCITLECGYRAGSPEIDRKFNNIHVGYAHDHTTPTLFLTLCVYGHNLTTGAKTYCKKERESYLDRNTTSDLIDFSATYTTVEVEMGKAYGQTLSGTLNVKIPPNTDVIGVQVVGWTIKLMSDWIDEDYPRRIEVAPNALHTVWYKEFATKVKADSIGGVCMLHSLTISQGDNFAYQDRSATMDIGSSVGIFNENLTYETKVGTQLGTGAYIYHYEGGNYKQLPSLIPPGVPYAGGTLNQHETIALYYLSLLYGERRDQMEIQIPLKSSYEAAKIVKGDDEGYIVDKWECDVSGGVAYVRALQAPHSDDQRLVDIALEAANNMMSANYSSGGGWVKENTGRQVSGRQ